MARNRFGRGLVVPGGVRDTIQRDKTDEMKQLLSVAIPQTKYALKLLFDAPSTLARFEDGGIVSDEMARQLGMVGPAGRASSQSVDVRRDHPTGWYATYPWPEASQTSGDVYARAKIRRDEWKHSVAASELLMDTLPDGESKQVIEALDPNKTVVSLVEGWRGEICHLAQTNETSDLSHYRIVDPSFHNWMGLAMALRHQEISDFPMCNKSFNLSYCGHDL